MSSNKAEGDVRKATQEKITQLEDKSALLKDHTWLIKVPPLALMWDVVAIIVIWLLCILFDTDAAKPCASGYVCAT